MTDPDLAALSEAATWCGKKPLVLECVEGGIWQLHLIFGEGDDACHAMRQWSDEYRAGRLVQIDPEGMRERVIEAVWNCGFHPGDVASGEAKRRIAEWPEDYAKACRRADAAIAAMMGGVK